MTEKKLSTRPIPINMIKQIMKRHVNNPLSQKSLILVSKYIEQHIEEIAQMCNDELRRKNLNPNRRNKHYIYSRIDDYIVKRVINQFKRE